MPVGTLTGNGVLRSGELPQMPKTSGLSGAAAAPAGIAGRSIWIKDS
jgi:hypothetical protein